MRDEQTDQPTTLQRSSSGGLGPLGWRTLLAQDIRSGSLPGLLLVGFLILAFVGQWFIGGPEQLGLSRQSLAEERWFTLASHAGVHAGFLHLWMNCGAVLSMTIPARMILGAGSGAWVRYLILLLAAAITSALAFLLIHPDDDIPMVGASGAICGLWGLLVRSDLETCTLRSLTAKPVLIGIRDFAFSNLVLFAILFVLVRVTESQGGLAWEGHLGGFLFGLMAAPFFVRQRSLPRN